MPRNLYCIPCGIRGVEAASSVVIDGDPMCSSCARDLQQGFIARAPEPDAANVRAAQPSVPLCGQGCGQPKHRGRCKGSGGRTRDIRQKMQIVEQAEEERDRLVDHSEQPSAPSVVDSRVEGRERMDRLVAKEIALADIPEPVDNRRSCGRMGALWQWLKNSSPEAALEVVCRDVRHVCSTHRDLRNRAREHDMRFYFRRVDSNYYISKSAFPGAAKAWE